MSIMNGLMRLVGIKQSPQKNDVLSETQYSMEELILLFLTWRMTYKYLKDEIKLSDEELVLYRQTYFVLRQELKLRYELMRQMVEKSVEEMKEIPISEGGIKPG